MPEIEPYQALCALMLGTGETQLVLDPEVIEAVKGVEIKVEYLPSPIYREGEPDYRWYLTFRGMPDKDLLEAKGMRIPDVPTGYHLGAEATRIPAPALHPDDAARLKKSLESGRGPIPYFERNPLPGIGEDHPRRRQSE